LRVLSNAVKAWLIAYHECVAVAAGLLGKLRKTPCTHREAIAA
jgi:hypothetical protein